MGESSIAWISVSSHGLAVEEARHARELEAVRLAQRQHDGVLGGRGLQLEVEGAAEFLAQAQAEGAVHARAERRVDDELHAAGLVEEALEHQRVAAWVVCRARPWRRAR